MLHHRRGEHNYRPDDAAADLGEEGADHQHQRQQRHDEDPHQPMQIEADNPADLGAVGFDECLIDRASCGDPVEQGKHGVRDGGRLQGDTCRDQVRQTSIELLHGETILTCGAQPRNARRLVIKPGHM